MRVKIKEIKANFVDCSTMDSDDFIINHWRIIYEVTILNSHFSGEVGYSCKHPIESTKVIDYIKSLYQSAENIIKTQNKTY